MQETKEPAVSLHQLQHTVTGSPVPRIASKESHHGRRQVGGYAVTNFARQLVAIFPRNENERLQIGVVLHCETLKGLCQPIPRLVDHHDGHN